MPTLRWTDNHCHLPDDLAAAAALVDDARTAGVTRLLTVGVDVASSRAAIELAGSLSGVWATAGVHPHEARHGTEGLAALLDAPGVVAVGECGLDYHYDHSPRDTQRQVFAAQVELARATGMPLVVHTREAWDDTLAVLVDAGVPDRVIIHCFTGGADEARRCLDVGAYLSFSGIVTFPSAHDVRAAAALCPADRLLVETDSPYLTPVPHRGRPNRPANVTLIGAAVAEARGEAVSAVAQSSWSAAGTVYGLPETTPA